MMLHDPTILTFVIVANILAIVMVWITWRSHQWGRRLFALNFIGAAFFNGIFWYIKPEEYGYYSEFVWVDAYRNFILGPFLNNLRLFLGLFVLYQLYVGIGLLSKGWLLKSAALLGILFLIAIAPFGLGAAFPATLIQSVGLFWIYREAVRGAPPQP
jgi:hypothetical protein